MVKKKNNHIRSFCTRTMAKRFLITNNKERIQNLKSVSVLLLIFANVKSYKTFEEDTYDCMIEAGFKDMKI